MNIKELLEYDIISLGGFELSLLQIISAAFILIMARVALFVLQKYVLKKIFETKLKDPGRQYAILQFIKYVIYTIASLAALQTVGINLSIIMAGGAALLVGMSLGLQQLFSDLVSGIILLIDGSISVKDTVELDGIVGNVKEIGIRTSILKTRNNETIIVPNSKFVSEKIINWSRYEKNKRFQLSIGVGYHSDVEQVRDLLLQAATEHPEIVNSPKPWVQFAAFGDSALQFTLHFHSSKLMTIEVIKSELRFTINKLFRSNQVEIPFPQQDLWVRNPEVLKPERVYATEVN